MVNMDGRTGERDGYKRERSGRSIGDSNSNKVYVSNIDFACTHTDLKDFFGEVGEVAFVEMIKDQNQRPNGTALIRFREASSTEDAIRKMNRRELHGRKIVVKDERDAPRGVSERERPGTDRKRSRANSEQDHPHSRSSMSTVDKFSNPYGLSAAFLESIGVDGPITNRIFVANLDYTVHSDNLKDVFALAGNVVDVELVQDDDGKSKGFGFIEFEHPVEAIQAISMMHNQLYYDRPMSVQITRKERRKDAQAMLPKGLSSVGAGLGPNGQALKDVAKTLAAGSLPGSSGGFSDQNQGLMGGATSGLAVNQATPLSMNMGLNSMVGMGLGSGVGMGMNSNIGMGINSGMGSNSAVGMGMSSLGGSLNRGMSDTSDFMSRSRDNRMQSSNNVSSGMGLLMDRAPSASKGMDQQSGRGLGLVGERPGVEHPSTFRGSLMGSGSSSSKNVVEITNLPQDYSWKSLQSFCAPFGEVAFAKMTNRGAGIVHFENDDSARSAIDMLNNQRFEGQYLKVKYA